MQFFTHTHMHAHKVEKQVLWFPFWSNQYSTKCLWMVCILTCCFLVSKMKGSLVPKSGSQEASQPPGESDKVRGFPQKNGHTQQSLHTVSKCSLA